MFGNEKKIKFRVLDLHNSKVLEEEDIPQIEGNLPEIIRQFSGMSYQLSEYSGMIDKDDVEMYDEDKVIVYEYNKGGNLEKIGKGQVSVGISSVVDFIKDKDGEPERCYLDSRNRELEFKVVGNHFDKWEDILV